MSHSRQQDKIRGILEDEGPHAIITHAGMRLFWRKSFKSEEVSRVLTLSS
jgi:hypothetical protein